MQMRFEPETEALRALQEAMADSVGALARRTAMHPTDVAAMNHLSFTDGPVTPGELAAALGLSPAAATELVDRLEAAGHVERHRDLADRRRLRLHVSPAAVELVFAHLGSLVDALDRIARETPPADRDAVRRYLERCTAAWTSWTADGG